MLQNNLIFSDFDGTLTDMRSKYYNLYKDAIVNSGGEDLGQHFYWAMKRENIAEKDIAEKSFVTDTDKYLAYRLANLESLEYQLYDSLHYKVYDTLKKLAENNYAVIVISARKNKNNLIDELHRFTILSFCKDIICGDDDKYNTIVKEGYANSKGNLIIGDTVNEIETGKALGLVTVSVTSGIRNRAILAKAKPDYIIDGFYNILKIVNDNRKV